MVAKRLLLMFALASLCWGGAVIAEDLSTSGNWVYFSDTVMGGRSSGTAERVNVDDRAAIKLTGNVTTENNGGFVQVRREIDAGRASEFEGLTFKVKGNGETY
ncbi:MAG: CIA30 family protein, partial [Paracoccaceae bacterium]